MLKQALELWKSERKRRGSSLHRRLVIFFISVCTLIILLFTLILSLLGITGREEKLIHHYMDNELVGISQAVSEDFGYLSVDGINLAEEIARRSDVFLAKNGVSASELGLHPELITPLLEDQAQSLLAVVSSRSCGGAFILLDASINPEAASARAGIFIKKTQPILTNVVGVKPYYLRGPAQIAREHGIELMAQWRMEYDVTDQPCFDLVMQIARSHPRLPLSRLYYWTERITLKGNSEAGFLLCVPLRSAEGTVFGVCGIEVSDRMFKNLYTPENNVYEKSFIVSAPCTADEFQTSKGLVAGNAYLTGRQLPGDLMMKGDKDSFERYGLDDAGYAGKSTALRLYPDDSPYEGQIWRTALLMPEEALNRAAKGNLSYFVYTVAALLVLSLIVSILISRRYLKPVTEALHSIRSRNYAEHHSAVYLEISDLFEFLAQKDREYEAALEKLDREKQDAQGNYDQAQKWISHLSDEKMPEIDPDSFALFQQCLHTLTPREREIFDLYLDGKAAKEIMEILSITPNTLKYHNRNIYSKLGVNSRKQLLLYATAGRVLSQTETVSPADAP